MRQKTLLSKEETLSKPLRESENKILESLKGHGLTFTDLKSAVHLSSPSLSENLLFLQRRGMVTKDFETKEYRITSEGLKQLGKTEAIKAIKAGKLQSSTSPPVESIVGIDVPQMSRAEKKIIDAGTVDIAGAVFNQFMLDLKTASEKSGRAIPDSGRVYYNVWIDLKKAKEWDSAEGRNYKITALKEKEAEQC